MEKEGDLWEGEEVWIGEERRLVGGWGDWDRRRREESWMEKGGGELD